MESAETQSKIAQMSVGVAMVATNDYLEHWFDTAQSLESFGFIQFKEIVIHLFTNRPEEAKFWANSHLQRVQLRTHQIKGWGWPEATLFRYSFITENSHFFREDLLMYLDSDMEILMPFDDLLRPWDWENGLAFVQHPGFYRREGVAGIWDYLKNPKLLGPRLRSLKNNAKGIGSWETNPLSSAYVAPGARLKYVHGAVWFGLNAPFLKMSEQLDRNVKADLNEKYIAVWHDESHLNWYYSEIGGEVFGNELSGVRNYQQLKSTRIRILTVEKDIQYGRAPTQEFLKHD